MNKLVNKFVYYSILGAGCVGLAGAIAAATFGVLMLVKFAMGYPVEAAVVFGAFVLLPLVGWIFGSLTGNEYEEDWFYWF